MILLWIVATFVTTVFCLCGVGGHVYDAIAKRQMPQGDTTLAQLRYLIEENKSMRQNMLSRVERINEDARRISASIVPCPCQTNYNEPAGFNQSVAFTAWMNASSYSFSASVRAAQFPIVITNIGFGYNAANSSFTAPVSGLYEFSLAIYMELKHYVGLQVVHNGKPILRTRTGNYYTFHMASNSAIVNATVGDRFWVEHSVESDSSAVYGQEVTTFSGYLIKEF
ncbi:hypothetical protein CHS0354_031543 [Potamilus streckersoni]|uniref:C1q domain-containing protein n=1 Tax=Potamilus streckersoni TaxID=2493646 RepID=A0AAE0W4D2_9BIVA|nr:hypothetical protein CHS0354_031543 [Potamilus streckersoni]